MDRYSFLYRQEIKGSHTYPCLILRAIMRGTTITFTCCLNNTGPNFPSVCHAIHTYPTGFATQVHHSSMADARRGPRRIHVAHDDEHGRVADTYVRGAIESCLLYCAVDGDGYYYINDIRVVGVSSLQTRPGAIKKCNNRPSINVY
jgi:hypothetical protein